MFVVRGNQGAALWRWQGLDERRQQAVCLNDGFSIPLALDATDEAMLLFAQAVLSHSLTIAGNFGAAFEWVTPAG
jgi:hypothetical protein